MVHNLNDLIVSIRHLHILLFAGHVLHQYYYNEEVSSHINTRD